MATSSIKKDFVVSGKAQSEKFASAIEYSLKHSVQRVYAKANTVRSSDELRQLMAKRKKLHG